MIDRNWRNMATHQRTIKHFEYVVTYGDLTNHVVTSQQMVCQSGWVFSQEVLSNKKTNIPSRSWKSWVTTWTQKWPVLWPTSRLGVKEIGVDCSSRWWSMWISSSCGSDEAHRRGFGVEELGWKILKDHGSNMVNDRHVWKCMILWHSRCPLVFFDT